MYTKVGQDEACPFLLRLEISLECVFLLGVLSQLPVKHRQHLFKWPVCLHIANGKILKPDCLWIL